MISHRFAPVLRELQPLSDRFTAAGHRLFLVGGTVRDILLAELRDDSVLRAAEADDMFDIDVTTTARPDEIKRFLQGWADAVWTQGERFGTIGAMKRVPSDLPGASPDDMIERIFEITTHRAEAYHGHSRKPEVEFSFEIEADLSRRDFTVNAMAIEVTPRSADGELVVIDPFGGLHDLGERVLRTPLGPEVSFSDDPLRMLRAARFIARYRLRPDEQLLRAVRTFGDRMQIVSAERIRDELVKLLAAPLPSVGLRFVADTGLLQHVVPELLAAGSQADEPCHDHLWAHTIDLIDAVSPSVDERRLVRMAALLHPLGPRKATDRLRALRAPTDDTRDIVTLIELRASVLARFVGDDAPWSDGDVRRYVRDAGPLRAALQSLVRAEASVHAAPLSRRLTRQLETLEAHVVALSARESLGDLGPQLDGAQVMAALQIDQGPSVGEALSFLTAMRLDDGVLDVAEVRRRLEAWWTGQQSPQS